MWASLVDACAIRFGFSHNFFLLESWWIICAFDFWPQTSASTTFFLIVTSDTIPERSQTKRGGYAIRFNSDYLCVKKRWKKKRASCSWPRIFDGVSESLQLVAADPEHFYYIWDSRMCFLFSLFEEFSYTSPLYYTIYIRIYSISCSCGIVLTFSAPYVVKMTTRVWRPFRRRWKRKRRDTLILFRDKLFIFEPNSIFLIVLSPNEFEINLTKFYMKLYNCSTPIIIKITQMNQSLCTGAACGATHRLDTTTTTTAIVNEKKSYTIALYFIWYGVAGG